MPTFLTVREAAQRYGKSPTSIRRAIYPIVRDDTHADRGSIEPSVEEALKLRVSGVSFPWRISEDLLARIVHTDAGAARGPMNGGGRPTATFADADFIAFLHSEVEIKNQQIRAMTRPSRRSTNDCASPTSSWRPCSSDSH